MRDNNGIHYSIDALYLINTMGERWVDQGTQTHACTSTQSHTYTHKHLCACTCMHTQTSHRHTHTRMHAHIQHINVHACKHTCVGIQMCLHTCVGIQMCLHTCASTCTCISSKGQIIHLSTLRLPFEMLHSSRS